MNSSEIYRHYVEIMCKSLQIFFFLFCFFFSGIALHRGNIFPANRKHSFPLNAEGNYKEVRLCES